MVKKKKKRAKLPHRHFRNKTQLFFCFFFLVIMNTKNSKKKKRWLHKTKKKKRKQNQVVGINLKVDPNSKFYFTKFSILFNASIYFGERVSCENPHLTQPPQIPFPKLKKKKNTLLTLYRINFKTALFVPALQKFLK